MRACVNIREQKGNTKPLRLHLGEPEGNIREVLAARFSETREFLDR